MKSTDYIDRAVIERLRSVLLSARFPVAGAFSGNHRSIVKGSAMEFSELRDYAPGDDLRRLDWKAYGRSDKFFLKEYESENNAQVYFLIDTSASMNFIGDGNTKRLEYSKQIVATLSALFLYQADSVGIVQKSQNGLSAPLFRGESSLVKILNVLATITASGSESFSEQVHGMIDLIPKRSIVVLVSDFFTSLDELEKALQHLNHSLHEVTLLNCLSKAEIDFGRDTATSYKDLESGRVLKTSPKMIKNAYHKSLSEHLSRLEKIANRNRAEISRFEMESSVESVLRSILKPYIERS